MSKNWLRFLAIGLVVMGLGACGGDDDDKDKPDTQNELKIGSHKPETGPKKEVLPICPQVAVVRKLGVLKDYAGEKPDPKQLVSTTKMLGVDGDCEYTDTGVDITFSLSFAAERGPRLGGKVVNAPYFVALVSPDGKIISKDRMTAKLDFGSDKVADLQEDLHVFLPLPKDKRDVGPNYQVLMGFRLTNEQLAEAQKN
ncbi:MAG: hypothetical protein JO126_05465 [Alphaproteobacteria bacterium]|nr:hypothetical protein [Alphaproteobacteria bacterium]